MEAKELRIGNQCKEITHSFNGVVKVSKRHFEDIEDGEIDLFPIPLTEEWHNKFGVLVNGFMNFEYEIRHRTKVIFNDEYVFLRFNNEDNKFINDDIITLWSRDEMKRDMFVHEWQNLFKALTNKELNIK